MKSNTIYARLDTDLKNLIDVCSEDYGVTRSDIIRAALQSQFRGVEFRPGHASFELPPWQFGGTCRIVENGEETRGLLFLV